MKTTLNSKVFTCANNIMVLWKDKPFNWRYQMELFGKAMRGHLAVMRKENMKISKKSSTWAQNAEALLKQECDGKDCSFQTPPAEIPKNVQKALEFVAKEIRLADGAMKDMNKKRPDNPAIGFTSWAEWNFVPYVMNELSRDLWQSIEDNIKGGLLMNRTEEEIVQYLQGVREGFVDQVMKARIRCSTSAVANLIEQIKIDVYRRIAGSTLMDSGSLAYLLAMLKGKI